MISPSKLYSFIDQSKRFNIQMFEAQKVIHDLVLNMPSQTNFAFFRSLILGLIPLNLFIKQSETLGIYIDNSEPFFKFKIEMSSSGAFRTLFLPRNADLKNNFSLNGQLRVVKMSAGDHAPYTSIIKLENQDTATILNYIVRQIYQIDAEVFLSDSVDQSLMLVRLPPEHYNVEDTAPSLKEFIKSSKEFKSILENGYESESNLLDSLKPMGWDYLLGREIKFHCPCSKDKMLTNMMMLPKNDIEHVFEHQETIEVSCDYCHKTYSITQKELESLKIQ